MRPSRNNIRGRHDDCLLLPLLPPGGARGLFQNPQPKEPAETCFGLQLFSTETPPVREPGGGAHWGRMRTSLSLSASLDSTDVSISPIFWVLFLHPIHNYLPPSS